MSDNAQQDAIRAIASVALITVTPRLIMSLFVARYTEIEGDIKKVEEGRQSELNPSRKKTVDSYLEGEKGAKRLRRLKRDKTNLIAVLPYLSMLNGLMTTALMAMTITSSDDDIPGRGGYIGAAAVGTAGHFFLAACQCASPAHMPKGDPIKYLKTRLNNAMNAASDALRSGTASDLEDGNGEARTEGGAPPPAVSLGDVNETVEFAKKWSVPGAWGLYGAGQAIKSGFDLDHQTGQESKFVSGILAAVTALVLLVGGVVWFFGDIEAKRKLRDILMPIISALYGSLAVSAALGNDPWDNHG